MPNFNESDFVQFNSFPWMETNTLLTFLEHNKKKILRGEDTLGFFQGTCEISNTNTEQERIVWKIKAINSVNLPADNKLEYIIKESTWPKGNALGDIDAYFMNERRRKLRLEDSKFAPIHKLQRVTGADLLIHLELAWPIDTTRSPHEFFFMSFIEREYLKSKSEPDLIKSIDTDKDIDKIKSTICDAIFHLDNSALLTACKNYTKCCYEKDYFKSSRLAGGVQGDIIRVLEKVFDPYWSVIALELGTLIDIAGKVVPRPAHARRILNMGFARYSPCYTMYYSTNKGLSKRSMQGTQRPYNFCYLTKPEAFQQHLKSLYSVLERKLGKS